MEIKKVIKQVPIQKVEFEEKEVDVYVTEDGKEFSSITMALGHEKHLQQKKREECYSKIEQLYVDMQYIPDYEYLQIFKVKNAEEAKSILNIRDDVDGSINIDSMKFPNMIIISSYSESDRDYGYYRDFEKIGNLISEYQPFVDFYNKMLELKKEYELGDNQYG